MLHITLPPPDRAALQTVRRDASLTPLERDRVEMVLLAATGWSPPRIAAHLGRNTATVRTALRRYQAAGPAGLRQQRTGPPPAQAHRAEVTAALTALLEQDRTWTATQLAEALREQGFALSTRQTRRYLGGIAAWRRTARSLRHRQNPQRVQTATTTLGAFKKGRRQGASLSAIATNVASVPASR